MSESIYIINTERQLDDDDEAFEALVVSLTRK